MCCCSWANLVNSGEQVVNATAGANVYLHPESARQLLSAKSSSWLPHTAGSRAQTSQLQRLAELQSIEERQQHGQPAQNVTAETHSRAAVRSSRLLQHVEERLDTKSQLQRGYQASSRGRSAAADDVGGTNMSQTSNSHAVYTHQMAVATRQPSVYSVYELKMSCLTLFVAMAAVSVVQGCVWGIKKVMRMRETGPL